MKSKWLQEWRDKLSSRSPLPGGGTRQDAPSQSGPSVSTPAPITPEPQASSAVPAVKAPKDPIRTRIWNSAYDKAKEDEPRLVEAYEKILSAHLGDADPAPLDRGSTNVIKQDADARQDQMKQLVEKGLEKTERGAKAKENVKEGMQPIKNVKDFVALAVKTEPSATVAWVGITTCMEIITNPVTEPGINRDGIKHVLETVQWYWELSDLLDADGADESTIKLQELLEKHIASLYKKLLVYQMQSVCLYNKHWAAVLVRDLVKVDDWQEKVDSIKKAEEAIREKVKQKNSEILKSRLACIDDKLGHLRLDIQAVTSAVGEVESAVNEQTRGLLKMHYDEKDNECLRDLCIINPQTHKKQLEKTKGTLLKDSYRWILDNDDFRGFRSDSDRRLLWIKGDPGKGKTMLLCGIIDELEKESTQPLSYFFCQATQNDLRSAISVLRGLVWLLCKKHPELMPCVRESYDMEGKRCFEDSFSLKVILERMLQSPCLQNAILIVDALDECSYQRHNVVEREELIDLIIELSESFGAKWIVSSRNWPVIEGQFRPADKIVVSLELNKDSISRAVESFVRHKTDELARLKPYDEKTKETVLRRLLVGANDTFLWVALVCKELARPVVKPWETLAKLDHLRTGLDDLYKRMLEQIATSDYSELCRQILAIACVAYRPLSLDELQALVPELQAYGPEALKDFIGECGSFLTLQEDVIYFVHLSAQDFLLGSGKGEVFPSGIQEEHRLVFKRSLEALRLLRKDMYGLNFPGVSIKDISPPDPDPLSPLKYSSLYWIDHFQQLNQSRNKFDCQAVDQFLRQKYLYWLEALSLQQLVGPGSDRVQKLKNVICDTQAKSLECLVEDARRFLLSYLQVIVEAPLQLYAAALVFSPTGSVIRQLFKHEEPSWLSMKPRAEPNWGARVLRLEMSKGFFQNSIVAISPDGKLLAGLQGHTVQIFNIGWRHYTHSINIDSVAVSAKFAPNGEQLAVGAEMGGLSLLDAKSGRRIQEFAGHRKDVDVIAFSPDGKLLASASSCEVIMWDLSNAHRLRTFDRDCPETCHQACRCERYCDCDFYKVYSVSFSVDSQQLVSESARRGEMRVWDVTTGDCIWRVQAHTNSIKSLAFLSKDFLVSGSCDGTVKIWGLAKRVCSKPLDTHSKRPSVVSLQDGSRFAHFRRPDTVEIFNETRSCLHTVILDRRSRCLEFLPGQQLLATTSSEALSLWDLASKPSEEVVRYNGNMLSQLVLSCDGGHLASASQNGTVKLWNTSAGTYEQLFDYRPMYREAIELLTFSEDGSLLILQSHSVLVWDTTTGHCLGTYKGGSLSPDGQQLASMSAENAIMIHDLSTGNCIQTLEIEAWERPHLVDLNRLVLASRNTVEIWDILEARCIARLSFPTDEATGSDTVALSNDSNVAALYGDNFTSVWNLATEDRLHTFGISAHPLTISPDKEWMVYFDRSNKTVGILKLETGEILPGVKLSGNIGPWPWRLDPNYPFRLHTEWGVIDLTNTLRGVDVRAKGSGHKRRHKLRYFGYGLSVDGAWIVHGSTRILWLPPEYRKKVIVMSSTVAIAHEESGQVSVVRFGEEAEGEDGR